MITLTTDFGPGFYVGAMKGAMYNVHPDARIEDITHAVPPQDVVAGALALRAAAPLYPAGTVHVGVIDPGVGSDRAGLVVECRDNSILVGPDNGLLTMAMDVMEPMRLYHIEEEAVMREVVSSTFHGRDIFGPVAAHLDRGADPMEVGPEVEDWEDLDLPQPQEVDEGLEARVLAVDPFGNCILNVPGEPATRRLSPWTSVVVDMADERTTGLPFVRTYSDGAQGEGLLLVGSTGFMEIGVNRGNASRRYDLEPGDTVRLHLP